MTERKSVLSGIGTMAALTISSKLVRLIILMVTARFLTPEDFGVVAAFTMVFGFAYLIADMGIARTIIQRPTINEKHIGSALTMSVSFCFIVSFILITFGGLFSKLVTIEEIELPLKISAFMFLLLGVSNVCSALIQRNGNVVFIGKVQALGTIAGNIFVTVPLLYFDVGFWSIIIGLWVSELISLIFILFFGVKNLHFKPYRKEIVEIFKYASAFFFNNTLGLLSQQLDIAVVSRFMGAATLGSYSRSMQLIEFPNQIYMLVVDRVVFPVMSAMMSEKERLSIFFLKSISVLAIILTIGTINLVVGAAEIVYIMMGPGWDDVIKLLQILAVCIVFRALSSFMDSFLAAYDLVKILTVKQFLSLIILAISIFIGVEYGAVGVAYAVVVSAFIRFSITFIIILIKTQVKSIAFYKVIMPCFFSSLFILFVYYLLSALYFYNGLICILISTLLFFVFCIIKPIPILISTEGYKFIINKKNNRSRI